MPSEIIYGIECVFNSSKEKTFQALADDIRQALYECVINGELSAKEFQDILKEDGGY